jgi:heme exporter protein A
MPKGTDLLQLNKLACVKGERLLFSGLSCEIPSGSLVRVTGANGAGKTSLLRMIAGLSEPAAGEIVWKSQNTRLSRSEFLQDILYLGHASAIKDELLPAENLMANCTIQGEAFSAPEVHAVLEELGMGERLDVESLSLSAGQRRRIALARVWLTHRPLWLLDEPFNALDVKSVEQLCLQISYHVGEGGICLYTTHQPVDIVSNRQLTIPLDAFCQPAKAQSDPSVLNGLIL